MAVRTRAQLALTEKVINDAELEAALERREHHKGTSKAAAEAYKGADGEARELLAKHAIADAPVRCGRFVISEQRRDGREVRFETAPSKRLSIRADTGEE